MRCSCQSSNSSEGRASMFSRPILQSASMRRGFGSVQKLRYGDLRETTKISHPTVGPKLRCRFWKVWGREEEGAGGLVVFHHQHSLFFSTNYILDKSPSRTTRAASSVSAM